MVNQTTVHGPGDIEGHIAPDGRFYILDLARVYPPESSRLWYNQKGGFLFRCLRPELVQVLV